MIADGDGFTSECCPWATSYLRHEWLRSVRREAAWQLRVRTTRYLLAGIEDRVRLNVRNGDVDEIGPTECVG